MPEPSTQHLAADAYERYVSTKIGMVARYEEADYRRFAALYGHYLRGWLPCENSASILDAGCGHGNALYAFAAWGYTNVDGVDLSAEQVDIARTRFPQVVQGDVFDVLEAHPEHYDLITAFDLIEHLNRDRGSMFLDRCLNALRPGGRLILQTPNAAALRAGTIVWGDITHETAYSPSAIRQLLLLNGFSDVSFRETRPVAHGLKSTIRLVLWHTLRSLVAAWDQIENGHAQPVHTRNMLVTARRPDSGAEESAATGVSTPPAFQNHPVTTSRTPS